MEWRFNPFIRYGENLMKNVLKHKIALGLMVVLVIIGGQLVIWDKEDQENSRQQLISIGANPNDISLWTCSVGHRDDLLFVDASACHILPEIFDLDPRINEKELTPEDIRIIGTRSGNTLGATDTHIYIEANNFLYYVNDVTVRYPGGTAITVSNIESVDLILNVLNQGQRASYKLKYDPETQRYSLVVTIGPAEQSQSSSSDTELSRDSVGQEAAVNAATETARQRV